MDIESEDIPEVLTQVLDTLRQYLTEDNPVSSTDTQLARAVCNEILVRISLVPKAFSAMKDAGFVMVAAGADERALQVPSAYFLLILLSVFRIWQRELSCKIQYALSGARLHVLSCYQSNQRKIIQCVKHELNLQSSRLQLNALSLHHDSFINIIVL